MVAEWPEPRQQISEQRWERHRMRRFTLDKAHAKQEVVL
jgi:hypothetical protein